MRAFELVLFWVFFSVIYMCVVCAHSPYVHSFAFFPYKFVIFPFVPWLRNFFCYHSLDSQFTISHFLFSRCVAILVICHHISTWISYTVINRQKRIEIKLTAATTNAHARTIKAREIFQNGRERKMLTYTVRYGQWKKTQDFLLPLRSFERLRYLRWNSIENVYYSICILKMCR